MDDMQQKSEATAERLGIRPEQIPRGIAIIMDGNGRWAQQKGLMRFEGHRAGARTAKEIAQTCVDWGIESLTLYSFSMENWKRPQKEVSALMHLYTEYLVGIRPTLMRDNVRLLHLGRRVGLPDKVIEELDRTMEMTRGNSGMRLALALNYSGRAEIIDATRAIAEEHKNGQISLDEIDEGCISRHLNTVLMPDPDLLVRTAGEMRVSNFLLWQISYSEFYVTKTLWPDFNETSLEEAILGYSQRDRRFGAIEIGSQPRS
jgi:undecaprenyl diphosphate synthase